MNLQIGVYSARMVHTDLVTDELSTWYLLGQNGTDLLAFVLQMAYFLYGEDTVLMNGTKK